MLERIQIKNLVLIDEVEVNFRSGLNIVSGETGAGKSMLLHAISLLLGERGSAEMIRAEQDEAVVIGVFDLTDLPTFKKRLQEMSLPVTDSELWIKRVLQRSGKHKVFINSESVPLAMLQKACEGLVDLCGQHEHQTLLRSEMQLDLLDQYAEVGGKVAEAAGSLFTLRELEAQLLALTQEDPEARARRLDFLKYQVSELAEADLQDGEDELLQTEKQQWQDSEKRQQWGSEILQCLGVEDGADGDSLGNRLKTISDRLENFSKTDPHWKKWSGILEQMRNEITEFELEFSKFGQSLVTDPEREEFVRERLAVLASLRRKYGATVQGMKETHQRLCEELESLEKVTESQDKIQKSIDDQTTALRKLATNLTREREKAAKKFNQQVTSELRELRLEQASVDFRLERREDISDWTESSLQDRAVLNVCLNPGEGMKPLAKVASGGELSRIMLAIRRVISGKGGIGVYLFDEIDAGIGGQTAFVVGRKLQSVAKSNQVICITHLPQIAAFADHHVTVSKRVQKGRTITEIRALESADSVEEIARMLGGRTPSAPAIKNAKELIAEAKRG